MLYDLVSNYFPIKSITMAKTSWTSLDMQRSKLIVTKWYFSRKGKRYVCLVFSSRLGKTSCEKKIHEGNCIEGHKCKIKCSSCTFSTNYKGKWFFITKSARFSQIFYCSTSSFLIGALEAKDHKWINLMKLSIKSGKYIKIPCLVT